jgi:hypothetical protein
MPMKEREFQNANQAKSVARTFYGEWVEECGRKVRPMLVPFNRK